MDQSSTLRTCYRKLEDRVLTALRTRIGDRQRLGVIRDDALMFITVMDEVSGLHRNCDDEV
jgi:hypothetical protein